MAGRRTKGGRRRPLQGAGRAGERANGRGAGRRLNGDSRNVRSSGPRYWEHLARCRCWGTHCPLSVRGAPRSVSPSGTPCPASLRRASCPVSRPGSPGGDPCPVLDTGATLPALASKNTLPRSRRGDHLAPAFSPEAPLAPRSPRIALERASGCDRAEGVGPTRGRVHARAEGASGKVLEGKREGGGAVGVRKHGFRKEEKENREEVEGGGRGG